MPDINIISKLLETTRKALEGYTKFEEEENEIVNNKGILFGTLKWNLNPEQKNIKVYFGKLQNGQFCFIPKADRLVSGQVVGYIKRLKGQSTKIKYFTVTQYKGMSSIVLGKCNVKVKQYLIRRPSDYEEETPKALLCRDIIYYDKDSKMVEGWSSLSDKAIEDIKKQFPNTDLGVKW